MTLRSPGTSLKSTGAAPNVENSDRRVEKRMGYERGGEGIGTGIVRR